MKVAIKRSALVAAATLVLGMAGTAFAVTTEPVLGFAGNVTATLDGVGKSQAQPGTNAIAIVYDNTASPANFGVSSTDLAANWGDRLLTTGPGLLNAQKLTLFNPASSAGPVLTATLGVDFFDGVTTAPLGGYQANVNFGAGLNPGFFSTITVTGIEPAAILLAVTDIIVVQRVVSHTGTANRLGVVSQDPPTVGSSPTSMYISASTIGGGVPGFYTFPNGPANPGYQIVVSTDPVGVAPSTWGAMKDLYR